MTGVDVAEGAGVRGEVVGNPRAMVEEGGEAVVVAVVAVAAVVPAVRLVSRVAGEVVGGEDHDNLR